MDEAMPPESEELTLCLLRYLNLSSEEFYLWDKKYIDQAVWEIWEDEIQRMLKSQLMKREWPKLEPEFGAYPKFSEYVKRYVTKSHNQLKAQPLPQSSPIESTDAAIIEDQTQ